MIKLLHTGDLHLKAQDEDSDYSLECLQILINRANAEQVDAVLLCGDIFDRPSDYTNREFCQKVMARMDEASMPLLYIPGNHEGQSGEYTRLRTIDWGKKLKLFTEVGLYHFSDKLEILHIPHSPNYDKFTEWKIPPKRSLHRISMAHGEIPGFTFLGDEEGAGVLNPAIFQHHEVDQVFLGHIHLSECIRNSGIEFYYAGSPRPVRRKETGVRGYNIITVGDSISVERHPLSEVGEVKNISTTVLEENWAESLMLNCPYLHKNDRLHITLTGLVSNEMQTSLEKLCSEIQEKLINKCRRISFSNELEPLEDLLENPFYKRVYEIWLAKKPTDDQGRDYQVWLQMLHSLKVIKEQVIK